MQIKKQDVWMVQVWQMGNRTRENVGRWVDICIKNIYKNSGVMVNEVFRRQTSKRVPGIKGGLQWQH